MSINLVGIIKLKDPDGELVSSNLMYDKDKKLIKGYEARGVEYSLVRIAKQPGKARLYVEEVNNNPIPTLPNLPTRKQVG